MKEAPSFIYRTAKALSFIGHPLLTVPLVSVYIAFQYWPLKNAVAISILLVIGVTLPISWYNYQKVRLGQYTNFDVSNQKQRTQFYPILIGLVVLVVGLSFITHQPRPFCYGAVCVLLLLICSYGVNHFIKASLHASLCFFLSWVLFSSYHAAGLGMGVFSILVGLSRLVLKRHTVLEIFVGSLIGLVAGACLYRLTVTST
jgi:membrane-associated phospholipid phosphatase